ncbi:MAG: substrate-binding domain-containing protein [Actinomycetota bacterium]
MAAEHLPERQGHSISRDARENRASRQEPTAYFGDRLSLNRGKTKPPTKPDGFSHHRIAFIGGAIALSPAVRRLDGYLKSVAEQERTDVLLGNFTMEWGYDAGSQLDLDLGTTAIGCANDLIAYGLLQWAQEENINAPGQLAITGFDDLPFSGVTAPPLTTVCQPIEELAEETLNLLTERVDQPDLPKREVRLRGQVIVRSST